MHLASVEFVHYCFNWHEWHLYYSDDFKPASVDTSKVSTVEAGDNNSVTVTVPHVEVNCKVL